MTSNTVVVGLQDVLADLRAMGDPERIGFELHTALVPAVNAVRSRAAGYARQLPTSTESRSKGGLAEGLRVVEGKNFVGVRETKPYGGPQEFGRGWTRRAHQRKNRNGGSSEVRSHEVTMHSEVTPRFLYRAVNDLASDAVVEKLIDAGLTAMFVRMGCEVTNG